MAFKTFTAGAVLTAADVNDYLMKQTVIVCTSGTRPGAPNEGMTIFETDTNRLQIYTGSAWSPVASTGDATPRCSVSRSTSQSIAENTPNTLISWTVEDYDVGGMFSATSTTAATIPSGWGGLYLITAAVQWAGNSSGYRSLQINTNGTERVRQTILPLSVGGPADTRMHLAYIGNIAAGQTVTVGVFQNIGGGTALNLTAAAHMPSCQVHYLSPTP